MIIRWLPNRQLVGDEQVVLFLRRHWFVLFTKYLLMAALALMPVGAYILFNATFSGMLVNPLVHALVVLGGSIYYLFIWLTVFTIFIDYYLDVWIVTTHRIIDIEQRGLFNHVVSEQSLEMIQDVSSRIKGVIPTLLDYGYVLVQTAGKTILFEFKQVPNPQYVAQTIAKLMDEFRDKHTHHSPQQPS